MRACQAGKPTYARVTAQRPGRACARLRHPCSPGCRRPQTRWRSCARPRTGTAHPAGQPRTGLCALGTLCGLSHSNNLSWSNKTSLRHTLLVAPGCILPVTWSAHSAARTPTCATQARGSRVSIAAGTHLRRARGGAGLVAAVWAVAEVVVHTVARNFGLQEAAAGEHACAMQVTSRRLPCRGIHTARLCAPYQGASAPILCTLPDVPVQYHPPRSSRVPYSHTRSATPC